MRGKECEQCTKGCHMFCSHCKACLVIERNEYKAMQIVGHYVLQDRNICIPCKENGFMNVRI